MPNPPPDRLLRIEAARYELPRAMHDAAAEAGDRRNTAYRRQHAANQAGIGYAILALLDEWCRIDAAINVPATPIGSAPDA